MSLTLSLVGLVIALVLLLLWALRTPATPRAAATASEETSRAHVEFLPQIRQALARGDEEFLARIGANHLLQNIRKERRCVTFSYLLALLQDFQRLLRRARIIASLSPEIGVGQEIERLRLTLQFLWKYRMIQLALYMGGAPLPQLDGLSNLISGLSVRLEEAMKVLGKQAVLAAEMLSTPNRGRIDLV